jgi:Holliday junction resolvase RusA-like endonuclease
MKIILTGNPIIKKNSRPIYKTKSRPILGKSAKLKEAEKLAHYEALSQKQGPTIDYPISIKFLFYRNNKRKVDLSNLYEFPQDILEGAGIIANDNLIESHDGSRKLYDKETPRTEIYIKKYES